MFKINQQVYVFGHGNGVVVDVTPYSVTVWFYRDTYRTFYDYVDIEAMPDDDVAGVA